MIGSIVPASSWSPMRLRPARGPRPEYRTVHTDRLEPSAHYAESSSGAASGKVTCKRFWVHSVDVGSPSRSKFAGRDWLTHVHRG